MLTAIRNFFDQHIADQPDEPETTSERRAQIAAAALLVEVARSDERFSATERRTVLESVQRKFSLNPVQAQQLLALAEAQSHEAHDIYQFTSKINATFPNERKIRLIEELWRAAYSDAVLHAHEEHLIRRVTHLLQLPHSQFIAAKLRVLAALERGE
jgi:uncharacterized tellurite resistance protein B-like protein